MSWLSRFAMGVLVASAARAQWSDDASVNLPLGDGSGEQTQAKIHPTADGGAYVSWFDNGTGGYDVRLQRLDAAGVEQWAHGGVLIADRSFSSTQDYSLDVDGAGFALLAFRDDRPTGVQITATRVDPSGTQVWGALGVQLTATTDFVAAPKIAATSDGFIVVAWTQESTTRLQKLDDTGAPQWAPDVVLTDPGGSSFSASDMHGADAGSVIISLVRGFLSPTYYAQKIAADGSQLWGAGSPLAIFDGGFLQIANFPTFVLDGAGGAVFGWYGTGPLQCYAQHVLANGHERFAHDGVAASTNLAQLRVSPSVSYSPATGETFLFWTELNSMQSQFGVYGQKYDGTGVRQWGNTGAVLVPVGATERGQVRNLQLGDGAVVLYVEGPAFGSQQVLATRLDGSAAPVWGVPTTVVSSAASGKSRLAVALNGDDMVQAAWIDTRNDAGDVYAQNVNDDGTLGAASIPGDLDGDGHVTVVDFLALLAAWGPCDAPCPPACPGDLDGDCTVGVIDFLALLANWG